MAAPVLVVLLMALGGRAMDQDGAGEASLGASSGPSPFVVLASPPQPKHYDAKAVMQAELRAMKADGDFRSPQIMMPKWRPPFPDSRQAPEQASLQVKPIDWEHLAVNGHENAAALPQEVFVKGASRSQELADAKEEGGELPSLSKMEAKAKAEPTAWSLEVKKAKRLSVLAADIQECKAAKALCFKAHSHIYHPTGGRTADEKEMAAEQEKKCKPLLDKCNMKATIQRMRVCDKMALEALEAAKPKKSYSSGAAPAYSSGEGNKDTKVAQKAPAAEESAYASAASRRLLTSEDDLVEQLQEEVSGRKILSYSSTPVKAKEEQTSLSSLSAGVVEQEIAALKKGEGQYVQTGLATPAAKLTPKADIATYNSAQLDSFEYKLSSDRARVNLPEIEGIFGHAAFAKVACNNAASQCDIAKGKSECQEMLQVCKSEVGKVKEVLCGMKRAKVPKKEGYASTSAAVASPESEAPKPKPAYASA